MLETIVALATPPLRSALAIVRLSGDDSFKIVSRFFSCDLEKITSTSIKHGFIKDGEEIVDEVVCLIYVAPHSFTGENSVEIISHGSNLITNKIIELALKNGAKTAERGEFSSRAYMNGKMDLIQAEAINDLINAESEESKNISMMALTGKTSELIHPLKKSLGDLLCLIEVNINYPEYTDIEDANYEKIISEATKNIDYIENLIADGEKGRIIKDGVNIAIVGKPNVGKSSLLNAFLNEEKAIVTDIKGTTRDVVEGKINLNGIVVNFYDTAGIRKSEDLIENIGIKKSIESIEKADLILAVFDSFDLDDEDREILSFIKGKNYLEVYNKSDSIYNKDKKCIQISALHHSIKPLEEAILKNLGIKEENFKKPSIANAREIGILKFIKETLQKVVDDCKNGTPIDLISVDIQGAYLKTLSLLGEDHDFDIANEIFSRFCLGK